MILLFDLPLAKSLFTPLAESFLIPLQLTVVTLATNVGIQKHFLDRKQQY